MEGINHIRYTSQNDPKWKDVLLAGGTLSVGNYGCADTCYSYVRDFFESYLDPGQIATNTLYTKNGEMQWFKLPFFRYVDGNIWTYDYQINNAMLDSYIDTPNSPDKANRAAIIGLHITPPKGLKDYTHFVFPLWRTVDNDIYIIDPWDGKSKDLFKAYGTYGKIYEVVYFSKNNSSKLEPLAPYYN